MGEKADLKNIPALYNIPEQISGCQMSETGEREGRRELAVAI